MQQRLELTTKSHIKDVQGDQRKERIKNLLGLDLNCRFIEVYNFGEQLSDEEMLSLAEDVFSDSITQDYSSKPPLFNDCWRIEIGMLPGVTDNVGKTA